jgi:hypothetical protein
VSGDYVNSKDMIINIVHANSDQVKAVGFLKSICQIIFSMMGRNPQNSIAEAEKFAPHFASTLAASPEVIAWMMAALLEGRLDGKPNRIEGNWQEEADALLNACDPAQKDYTVSDDASRMTMPTRKLEDVVPSITPRGFYVDGFGQYWQRRIDIKNGIDVMIPVIITANPGDPEPYHVPDSVAKFLDQLHITSCEAVEQGLAHVHNGVLKLYRNGRVDNA